MKIDDIHGNIVKINNECRLKKSLQFDLKSAVDKKKICLREEVPQTRKQPENCSDTCQCQRNAL